MPIRTTTRLVTTMIGVAMVAVSLAGCTPEPTPSPTPAPTTPATSDAPQTYELAEASADKVMLLQAELPGTWMPLGPLQSDTFREQICGASTEPVSPAGSFAAQWLRETDRRPLLQTARPVGATGAATVLEDLRKATGSCGGDAKGAFTSTFALSDPGVLGVALQYDGDPHHTFKVFFVEGDCLVSFTTFEQTAEPSAEAVGMLDDLIAAVKAKASR